MQITRRSFVQAGLSALLATAPVSRWAEADAVAKRRIPSTGEDIPAVGLGTWMTFNVGNDPVLRTESAAVMEAFFAAGGGMINSSPMYGSSQPVVGYGLERARPSSGVVLG